MTRPAEGVAAERMAEVGVGTPAITSGAAFVKKLVRVQVCGESVGWILRNKSAISDCHPFLVLLQPTLKIQSPSLVSLSRIPEFKANVS
jgi:hypothetical protein